MTNRKIPVFNICLGVTVGLTALFMLLPALIIIPISFTSVESVRFPPIGFSFRWYEAFWNNDAWFAAFLQSLQVGAWTVVLSLMIGISIAVALHRTRFKGKNILYFLSLAPLVTPIIVLAIGDFMVFSQWRITGTKLGLILAHTVIAYPLVVVCVTASLKSLNPNLVEASASLGAGSLRTFFKVTFPLLRPGVVAGGVFAFITSWDEVVTAIFLSDPTTRTLPVMIWSTVRTGISPMVAAVGTILIAISLLALLAVSHLERTKARETNTEGLT